MTRRRAIGERERAEIFARALGRCHICGAKIEAGAERWEVEHVISLGMGGDEAKGSDNLQPAHVACHRAKTAEDKRQQAKAQRMQRRALGIRKQPKRRLPGSAGSRWKKKVNGEVVQR